MYVRYVCTCAHGGQKGTLGSQKLIWVLGTKPGSSGREASALTHQAIFQSLAVCCVTPSAQTLDRFTSAAVSELTVTVLLLLFVPYFLTQHRSTRTKFITPRNLE